VGGWKAPALHVPAPTDALVEIAIPHEIGGRLSSKAALAGHPLEFWVPETMGALADGGLRPGAQQAASAAVSSIK